MAVETKEVLAARLYDQLERPDQMPADQLRTLLRDIRGSTDRPQILSLVRDRLSALSETERQGIQANLQVLSDRIGEGVVEQQLLNEIVTLRADLNSLKDAMTPPQNFVEWAGREANDIRTDFMEGSMLKKAGYVAGVYLGYRVARDVWRWARSWFVSEDKPEGTGGKFMRWLAAGAGAVAGALGISQLLKMFGASGGSNASLVPVTRDESGRPRLGGFLDREKDNPFVPDAVEEVIEPVAEGAFRGVDDVQEYLGPAFDVLMEHENTRDVLEHPERYKTRAEYVQALASAALSDGMDFAFEGGKGILRVGTQLLSLEGEFLSDIVTLLSTGEINMGDLYSTYVEGVVLYATSYAALKIITLNRFPGSGLLWEAGCWPYYVVQRIVVPIGKTAVKSVTFTYNLVNPESAMRLGMSRRSARFTQRRLSLGTSFFGKYSEEGLLARQQFVMEQMLLLERARRSGRIAPAQLASFETAVANSVGHFEKYLMKMPEGTTLPEWFLRAQKLAGFEGVNPRALNAVQLRDILVRVDPSALRDVGVVADTADLTVDTTRAASVAGDALPAADDALRSGAAALDATEEAADVLPFVDDAARAPAAVTEEGSRLARAVGDGVVEPAPRLATDAVEEVAEAAPGLRVVRETGEVVDPKTGRVIEEVAESAAPAVEAVRVTEVAEEAGEARRAVELLDASIREYKPVQQLLAGARGSQYAEVLAEAHRLHQAAGAKRVARYLLTMTDDLDDTRRAAMVAPEVIQLIAEGRHGNPVAIARTLSIIKLQPGAALDAAKCIRQMSAWRSSGTLGRSMQALGIAADVVMLGVDIYSLVESYNNREEHRNILVKGLTDAGLTSTDGENFSGFGIEVNISQMQEADVERYSTLVAADAAALGAGVAVTFMSLGASAGPVGLAVAGVAIAVNYSVNQIFTAFDQREREQFLSRAPQWLLAMLRTETLLQKSEHSLIREFNGVMTQDIWPADWKELILGKSIASLTEMRDPSQRERIRTKLLQSLCYQAILTRYPDLAAEIPGIANPREFFQENGQFLKEGGDFERIVKPYITLRLHAMTKGESVSFGSTNILDLSDNRGSGISAWWNDIPTINEHDLTRATEEGMLFYVHHLREVEFRDNLRDIDAAVEAERARLSSAGVTDPELTERVTLFRESHETALRDEMEAMKSRFFVFNQNPFALSSSRTGPTLAEQILADKSEEARMGSDERSAELVSRKWGIPGSAQNGDIEWFAREYVQPQFRDRAREYLVHRSPEAGKPFSFDELNEMGETKEQFATAFIEKMAPVRSVLAELTDGISTQEGLKKFIERNQSKIAFMTSVYDHEEYYRSYLTDWRGIGSGLIPENRMSFIKKIAEWKERGYPTLLDEDKFRQIQEFARSRPAPSPPGVVGPVPGLPVFSERPRVRIEQLLPGYDPLSRDKLYSLESYVALIRRLSAAAAASRTPENPLDLLMGAGAPPGRIRMPSGGARELLLRGVTPEEKPLDPATAINARFIAQLSELEKCGLLRHTFSAPDGTVTPLSSGDAVAVTPQELTMLMTILGGQPVEGAERFFGAPGTGDRPAMFPTELLNGSDFSLLQIYLLQSRVYVTDRAPEASR